MGGCNTVQLLQTLSTSFILNHAPNISEMNALITRFTESCSSVNTNRESKRLKKSSSWLNSDNALIHYTAFEWKMQFSCFPVLPDSAEAQVIWGGIAKLRLIAYFMSVKISKSVHMRPSSSKPKVGCFWDTMHTPIGLRRPRYPVNRFKFWQSDSI